MKIVNVIGGLGNQMFQYAFALALHMKFPDEKVFVDIQHYKNAIIKKYRGNNYYHNGYEIHKVFPNTTIQPANKWEILKVSFYIPNQILARAARHLLPCRKTEFIADQQPYVFIPEALTVNGNCYFDGYWMSSLYFNDYREEILREFAFRPFDTKDNLLLEPLLYKDNSITIHIRRGDYVGSNTLGGICSINYYRRAISEARKIIREPVFFVLSNDQDWCITNLKKEFGDSEVYFVSHNKGQNSFRDMQLMSIARCTILANSSFSWWGAYLNQRKDHITFCPDKWHNTMEYKDHYLDDWVKISTK